MMNFVFKMAILMQISKADSDQRKELVERWGVYTK